MQRYTYKGPLGEPTGIAKAVNAALTLRRPLLVTGPPIGVGLSDLAFKIAKELELGEVIIWKITPHTSMKDGFYESKGECFRLGAFGTALLPTEQSRVLLVDEIDRASSEFLLDFADFLVVDSIEIPELVQVPRASVSTYNSLESVEICSGKIQCVSPPIIVLTSHGEKEIPLRLKRECIVLPIPSPSNDMWRQIIRSKFDANFAPDDLVEEVVHLAAKRQATLKQVLDAIQWAAKAESRSEASHHINLIISEIEFEPQEQRGFSGERKNNLLTSEYGLNGQQYSSTLKHDSVHRNILTLLDRMDRSIKHNDPAGALHASASVFETMAKDIVGLPSIQNQPLGGFFARYRKDSKFSSEILDYIENVYQHRNKTPLAGHGSLDIPDITIEEATFLATMTRAIVEAEYTNKQRDNQAIQ